MSSKAVAEQPANVGQLTVKELMSWPIITIDRKMAPHYARDLMADRKIRHLGGDRRRNDCGHYFGSGSSRLF